MIAFICQARKKAESSKRTVASSNGHDSRTSGATHSDGSNRFNNKKKPYGGGGRGGASKRRRAN
jgi:hypothetical protein